MRSVSNSMIPDQVMPNQQKTLKSNEMPSPSAAPAGHGNGMILTEDIVNLSTERLSALDSQSGKKPSIPVSAAEKRALRESFSIRV